MATFTTTSAFSDLVGSMVVDDNDVQTYTSSTLGAGTVQNIGGKSTLEFTVNFVKGGPTYTIDATPSNGGRGYAGEATNGSPTGGEEPWTATASTVEPITSETAKTDAAAKPDAATKAAY